MTDEAPAPTETPAPTAGTSAITDVPEPTAAPSADPAAPNAPWYASIEDAELRGIAENRKWDSPEKALKSYRDLEKLRGVPADQLLRLPSDLSDPEFRETLAKRLGRPDSPDGYEGVEEAWLKDAAHKAGLAPDQVKALREAMSSTDNASVEQAQAEFAKQAELDMQDIKREWGNAYETKLDDVRRFTKASGFTATEIQEIESVIGTKKMMETFSNFGALTAEGRAIEGEMSADGLGTMTRMTREAALAKYNQMNGDPVFQARLMHDDPAVRQQAMAERSKFSKLAFDG